MQAKDILLEYPDGSGFSVIPGSTGDLSRESGSLDDTIFGQQFTSSQPSLINWSATANAFYKGIPGYVATVKKSGTSTTFTGEAASQVGSTQVWKIDDATKEVWDHTVDLVVNDGGSPVADSDIKTIDYLFGEVEFVSGFTPTSDITFDGAFLPLSAVAQAQSFELSQTADTEDVTTLAKAQANNGHNVFEATQLTASLSLTGFYDANNQEIRDLQVSRDTFVVELSPDGNGDSLARGLFKVDTDNLSGDAGASESEEINFSLFVPEKVPVPFGWRHSAGSTLSVTVQNALSAWLARETVNLRYFPEGSSNAGFEGSNEFSFSAQGSGELTDVPAS